MVALTSDRNTPRRDGDFIEVPVSANTRIFAGALVAINSSGLALPAANVSGQPAIGIAQRQVDNRGGTASAMLVRVCRLPHLLANNPASKVTRAKIGQDCFILDDQTVSLSGSSRAGRVLDVDDEGVWVDFRS